MMTWRRGCRGVKGPRFQRDIPKVLKVRNPPQDVDLASVAEARHVWRILKSQEARRTVPAGRAEQGNAVIEVIE